MTLDIPLDWVMKKAQTEEPGGLMACSPELYNRCRSSPDTSLGGLMACSPELYNQLKETHMHYRNGREAKNGDKIVKLEGGKIVSFGVLHSATPGNDYCNGNIAVVQPANDYACMCDCLHIDDVAELLVAQGLDMRPAGK